MEISELEKVIQPFYWVETESGDSVCLEAGEYKEDIFQTRADEGYFSDRM